MHRASSALPRGLASAGWQYAAAVVVFLVGVLVSGLLYRYVRDREEDAAQRDFERQAVALVHSIEQDLTNDLQLVEFFRAGGQDNSGLSGLSNPADYLTITRAVTRRMLRSTPGLEAVQFLAYVPGEQRQAFEAYVRARIEPDFRISDRGPDGLVPAAVRPVHIPIDMADAASGPLPVDGLDLAADAAQVERFQRVGASGEIGAWPVGRWETDDSGLVYRVVVPSYVAQTAPRTPEERRATLYGFSSFLLRPSTFFSLWLADHRDEPFDVWVYDDSLPAEGRPALVFTSTAVRDGIARGASGPPAGTLVYRTTLALADRTWRLELTPGPGYASATTWTSLATLFAGLVVTCLLVLYLVTVVRDTARDRRREAERREALAEANAALLAEVGERRQVEAALRRSERQYRTVVAEVTEVIFQTDAALRWTFLNPAWSTITGYSVPESLGRSALAFLCAEQADCEVAPRLDALVAGRASSLRLETRVRTARGEERWLELYATTLTDADADSTDTAADTADTDTDIAAATTDAGAEGAPEPGREPGREEGRGLSGTLTDVTERKSFEARLTYQAYHDALTGLPNRAGFGQQLAAALARRQAAGGALALLVMDVDGFKAVNDAYGHPAGDAVLVALAARLRGCVRPQDGIARLGGDEFTVILEQDAAGGAAAAGAGEAAAAAAEVAETAAVVAARVQAAFGEPVTWAGEALRVGVSVGIALSTAAAAVGQDELVRRADVALYEAKATGKGRACRYGQALAVPPPRADAAAPAPPHNGRGGHPALPGAAA